MRGESADTGGSERASPFGPRPEEKVFTGRLPTSPSLRVRPSADASSGMPPRSGGAHPTRLKFEPETGPQVEALAELSARPAAPKSSLAFEPDEDEVPARVREAPLPSGGPPPPEARGRSPQAGHEAETGKTRAQTDQTEDEGIASLIELAANVEAGKHATPRHGSGRPCLPDLVCRQAGRQADNAPPAEAPVARRQVVDPTGPKMTPAPRRPDLAGDLEAEFFGPRRGARRARGGRESARAKGSDNGESPDRSRRKPSPARGETAPLQGVGADEGEAEGRAARSESRGGLSVLVSDAAVGRKKRRRPTTARLLRTTRFAERAIGRRAVQVASAVGRIDFLLRGARLSLASIMATAVILAVAILVGVPLHWAGGILAMCLILTVAGQPARNLLGYAGIIIAAAAIAEIVRQRDRFLEILKIFLS